MATHIRNVVLVHGAFADGTSWHRVVPALIKRGLEVRAVQNPLTSLADDVAATRRVLDTLEGSTVLVGHSWAGVVITELGDHPAVAGLVYIAAAAPEKGQSLNDWWTGFAPAPGLSEIAPQGDGYLVLSKKGMQHGYAFDLSQEESNLLHVGPRPAQGGVFRREGHQGSMAFEALVLPGDRRGPHHQQRSAAPVGRENGRLQDH